MFLQFAQPLRRLFAEPFPKLVALEQQPRVGRIGTERPVVSRARLGGLFWKC